MRIAIDLDGVVWWGSETIPGAPAAVASLIEAGHQPVFVTNHALSPEVKADQLAAHDIHGVDVVTSAEAASFVCRDGERVAVLGERSLTDVLRSDGHDVVDLRDDPRPDGVGAVVVGAHPDWDRSRIGWAAELIRRGARFVATNDDPTYPVTEDGRPRLLPGNGALVAAVATASGVSAQVVGKPATAMCELLESRYGHFNVVIGDQPETDGLLAKGLNAAFALVLSGVTSAADLPTAPAPDYVADDIAGVADLLT